MPYAWPTRVPDGFVETTIGASDGFRQDLKDEQDRLRILVHLNLILSLLFILSVSWR